MRYNGEMRISLVFIFLFSQNLFSKSLFVTAQGSKAVWHYYWGAHYALVGLPSFFCANFQEYEYFCNEGYYNYAFRTRLFGRNQIYKNMIPKGNHLETAVYRGVGLSMPNLAHFYEVEKVVQKKVPKEFKAYLYDGWSFARVIENKYSSEYDAIIACEEIQDLISKRACLFGTGRAFFFQKKDLALIPNKFRPFIAMGYGYARGMNTYMVNFEGYDADQSLGIKFTRFYRDEKSLKITSANQKCLKTLLGDFLSCVK